MGIFNWFKKPVIIEDAYFGKLELTAFRNSHKNYFSGKAFFSPYNKPVEVLIDGHLPGPTLQQKAFYTNLQEQFNKYCILFTDKLHEEFKDFPHAPIITSFVDEFHLEAIHISRLETQQTWSIDFTTPHFPDYYFTFLMEGNMITGLTIDS